METSNQIVERLKAHRKWVYTFVALTVAVVLNLPLVSSFTPLQWMEYKVLDFRYRLQYELSASVEPPESIVVVGIDDYTAQVDDLSPELLESMPLLTEFSKPWPWSREVFAEALSKLLDSGARLVVFDFVFAGERPGDDSFVETIDAHFDRVVLASHFVVVDSEYGRMVREEMPEPFLPIDQSLDNQAKGFASIRLDDDGAIRRMHNATNLQYENRPELKEQGYTANTFSLAAVAYRKLVGEDAPLPPENRDNLINYQAPAGWFNYVSLKDLFVPDQWGGSRLQKGAFFKDKIVLVGPISEVRFKDGKLTPMGIMPGVEVHAHALHTMMELGPIRDARGWQIFGLSLLLVLVGMCLVFTRWPFILKIAAVCVVLIGTAVLTQLLFQYMRLSVPLGPPLLSLSTVGVLFFALDFTLERYERFRARSMLDRFVSPRVAKLLVDDPGGFEQLRHGDTRSVAIMFSDVRGFTTYSEKTEPSRVVAQLNEYFENQVDAILQTDGTLIAYAGDGLMAAWGDTQSWGAEQDATNAVESALCMIEGVTQLNEGWKGREDRTTFELGIGINYGEATVGNIGHSMRMEFGCLGDTTNTASRLEGATKLFKQLIIVSEHVYTLTHKHFRYRFVERVILKGRTEPITLYTPLGRIDGVEDDPAQIYYADAIKSFELRAFAEALELFQQAQAAFPSEDFLCSHYIERCESLMEEPLPDDWSSALALDSK
ncbi:MAG: CHASE2 domain-containing protein [Opitutaceae bacterium]